jgi:hypothetical protein
VEQHVAKAKPKNSAAAGFESKRHKTGPLRSVDFRSPTPLSPEKVSEICEALGTSDRRAAELKDYLDKLVSHLRDWMSREKAANRRGDRDRIMKVRKRITDAQYQLKGLGIDGRLAVRSTAARLADIVSGDWLRSHFPGDAPSRTSLLRIPRGIPRYERDPGRDREQDEKNSNYQFIRDRAPETLRALLRDLESVLDSALTSIESDPRARGGRQQFEYRDNVLLNLVNIYHLIGKTPVGTRDSFFAVFCKSVVEAMGWSTSGLNRAIPNAIKNFRNLQKNPARLRK